MSNNELTKAMLSNCIDDIIIASEILITEFWKNDSGLSYGPEFIMDVGILSINEINRICRKVWPDKSDLEKERKKEEMIQRVIKRRIKNHPNETEESIREFLKEKNSL